MIFSFGSRRNHCALSSGGRAALPAAILRAAALLACAAPLACAARAQTPAAKSPNPATPAPNAAPDIAAKTAAPLKTRAPKANAASTRNANAPVADAKKTAAKNEVVKSGGAAKTAAAKPAATLQKVNATKADAVPNEKLEVAPQAASTRKSAAPLIQRSAPNAGRVFRPATLLPPSSVGEKTLANGVRGIVQETPGSGVISIQVWVRAGSRYESNGESGAAHLVETVALRSSRLYPESADGPRGALEGLGASASSQTTRDATSYSVTVAPRFFGDALKILSDAVLHPRLQDTEVEISKAEVGSEISRRPFSGLDAASIDLRNAENIAYNAAFARHPYRHPPSGTLQNVLSLNAARVRAFHARRYSGKNISVVVSGEIDAATAQNLIAKNFADAKNSAASETKIAAESKAPKARVVTRRGYSPRPTTVLAYRSPSIAQPDDVVAMDVLLAYLGQGRDASLRRILLGESESESAATPAASTREAAPNQIAPAESAAPETPDIQPMPATMLEDRSPENSVLKPLPDEAAPAAVSGDETNAAPTARGDATQNAAASPLATPPNAATSTVQSDAANNGATAESATAEAPHFPPPPAVFLPQIAAPRREIVPAQNALFIAFPRASIAFPFAPNAFSLASNKARVLAARAKNRAPKIFDFANAASRDVASQSAERFQRAPRVLAGVLENRAPHFRLVQDAAPSETPAPNVAPAPPAVKKAAPSALAFDTSFLTQRDNGIVAFSLVTDNASRSRAVQLVRDELRKVRAGGIGKSALANAKTTLLRQYVLQGETPTGRAGALGFYDMISDYRFATTYIARIKRVTDADIQRVAARYFTDKPLVTVLIESPPQPTAPPSSAPEDGGIIA